MEADRIKWNAKYLRAESNPPVADILREYWHIALADRALDLACGLGQNSEFLAARGFRVDAVDIAEVGLSRIAHPAIRTIAADLDDYTIESGSYDLILDHFFLDRRLFASITSGLKPGGILIFETALTESAHIANPSYKLHPGELAAAFPALEQICYRERGGTAALVARRPPPSG